MRVFCGELLKESEMNILMSIDGSTVDFDVGVLLDIYDGMGR
jgi:hypothetical protein